MEPLIVIGIRYVKNVLKQPIITAVESLLIMVSLGQPRKTKIFRKQKKRLVKIALRSAYCGRAGPERQNESAEK